MTDKPGFFSSKLFHSLLLYDSCLTFPLKNITERLMWPLNQSGGYFALALTGVNDIASEKGWSRSFYRCVFYV